MNSCSDDKKLGTLENEWYRNDTCDTWVAIKETPSTQMVYKMLRTDCNKYIKVYRYIDGDYEKLTFLFQENGSENKMVFDKTEKNKTLTWTYLKKNYEKNSSYKCGCGDATQTTCPNF